MRADTAVVSPLADRTAGSQEAAARIAAVLPTHTHYVQLQSGGLEVLLHKPPSNAETINDTGLDIVTFWRVLRDRPDDLRRGPRTLRARCRRACTPGSITAEVALSSA